VNFFFVAVECQRGRFPVRKRRRCFHAQFDGACTEEGVLGYEKLYSCQAGNGG
jgi:hypothetical protein